MLGIVVVSYGSASLLRANLADVDVAALRRPALVVVVDNLRGPRERADVRATAAEHGWDLVENATNAGFGAAADAGVAHAAARGCTQVVVVNPDLRADVAVLDALADAVAADPGALVSPRVVRPDGRPWFTGGVLDVAAGRTRNVEAPAVPQASGWLSGACLAADVTRWQEVGGFDDDYFLYWEDVDLSARWTAAGGTLLVRQDLVVVHDVGGTQEPAGTRAKSPVYYRYNCRNRLVFAAKHLPAADVRRWLWRTPAYAWQVLLRGGRRQLLRPVRPGWAVVRGSAEGVGWAVRALLRPATVRADRAEVVA
ncbi:glycosyltransferase family 2 protein [Cellulomonas fimi]|uniref:Glycosyl transferase family 2 n=1 Tax=Cellulomonas fimi (strain ATCC 484 / DSM 20113 / JCM 1341 / CCUG 24087 / LMG 16345 / NBRC 15513 / NCIMB 8980 / NCTC 7547 / NRS-133) TaxID=590998 RepID=F4GZ46_CELFA|nr:glycosyltransferase family 2 protein [Cellulomonas fimi]AEE47162.1 glycosyl transferase family 2 [Cellulomonas fimi ATCC 484]NNH07701.1 glycosyltransferase family 2 protein [Cellulomonas fimi]VEH35450.1 dTDP-Rha:alpha-D-GlcNAc-pyrophosphate polyprenol, alpha-3-L-rhamnosyltransferase [Cellulomonas fimi]